MAYRPLALHTRGAAVPGVRPTPGTRPAFPGLRGDTRRGARYFPRPIPATAASGVRAAVRGRFPYITAGIAIAAIIHKQFVQIPELWGPPPEISPAGFPGLRYVGRYDNEVLPNIQAIGLQHGTFGWRGPFSSAPETHGSGSIGFTWWTKAGDPSYVPPGAVDQYDAIDIHPGEWLHHYIDLWSTYHSNPWENQNWAGGVDAYVNDTPATVPNVRWQPETYVPYSPSPALVPLGLPAGFPVLRPAPVSRPNTVSWPEPTLRPPEVIPEVYVDITPQAVKLTTPRPHKPRPGMKETKLAGKRGIATLAFWLWNHVTDWRDWLAIVAAATPGAPKGPMGEVLLWFYNNPAALAHTDWERISIELIGWGVDEWVGSRMGAIINGSAIMRDRVIYMGDGVSAAWSPGYGDTPGSALVDYLLDRLYGEAAISRSGNVARDKDEDK